MATLVLWYFGVTAVLGGALVTVMLAQFAVRRVRLPRRRWVLAVQHPAGRVQAPPAD